MMLHMKPTPTGEKCHLLNGPLKKRPFKFYNSDSQQRKLEALAFSNAIKPMEMQNKNFPLRSLPTVWNLSFVRNGRSKISEAGTGSLKGQHQVQRPLCGHEFNQELQGTMISSPKLQLTAEPFNVHQSPTLTQGFNPLKRSKKFINLHLISKPYPVTFTPEKRSGSSVSPNSGAENFKNFPVAALDRFVRFMFNTSDPLHRYNSENAGYPCQSQSQSQSLSGSECVNQLKHLNQYPEVSENAGKISSELLEDNKCKFCDKSYTSLCALKMHIQTHTRPFSCHLCGKCFSRPWLLQGHLRTHTGEKPFSCRQCERAFADRSNLRAHLQTHTKNKRYLCKKCSKSFSRMSLLLKHKEGCYNL